MFAPVMASYGGRHPTADRSRDNTHRYACDHKFYRRSRMRIPSSHAKQ